MQYDPTLLESSDTILSKQVAPMYSASDLLSSPPPPYDIPRARTSPPRTPTLISPTPITPRTDYLTRGADVLSMWNPASHKGTSHSRATSQASIPLLREALNMLESKMASLMSERDELESNLAQAVRLQSPIQRLPCEILSSIFVVGVFQAEDEDPLMVSTLMLVCRYWAELAIGTPQLWSNIVFSAHDSLEKARRKLQRSRACPIDVSINFLPHSENSSSVTENVIHAMDLVRPALWRTKSFSLNVPNRPQAHAALLRCQEDAPLLESLLIRINHSIQDDYHTNAPLPLFNGNTPRLRSCSFTSFNFGWDITLVSRLRVLQLGGYWNGFSPSTTTLLHILNQCPELEELSLRNLSDSDPEICLQYKARPPPRRIHLPRLIKASFHFAGSMRVRAIFNHLSFPALQALELCYCEEVTPVLERLKEQSLTSLPLRHLRIETSFFSEFNFMNLLRRLNSLTSLELVDCEDASSHLLKVRISINCISIVPNIPSNLVGPVITFDGLYFMLS